MLGLTIDEPIKRVISRLVEGGVGLTGEVVRSGSENFVEIEDLDGNALYLWKPSRNPSRKTISPPKPRTTVEAARPERFLNHLLPAGS